MFGASDPCACDPESRKDARALGLSEKEASEFCYRSQASAYKDFSLTVEQALQVTDYSKYHALVAGIPFYIAIQVPRYAHPAIIAAYEQRAELNLPKLEDILLFKSFPDLEARKAGVPLEFVREFGYFHQVEAFRSGASIEDALKIRMDNQIKALRLGVPASQASLFYTDSQLKMLQNVSVDDALKFKYACQNEAYYTGASIEYALQFTDKHCNKKGELKSNWDVYYIKTFHQVEKFVDSCADYLYRVGVDLLGVENSDVSL